ncbi:prophage tail fiber N-terminal domain-containing protein [Escherichia coli]|uniref:prophage tail fiber N-terminal domain-containing protein n=1 Tax=Escherichia coli TaxID=562 RepID=UPI00111B83CF|nr:prophage tail fiber N-terminal domain-containing protein [Escherichia coli]
MAVKISGVLKDGAGKPVQNCTIQLKAKRNSTTVVVNTVASENPDEAGRYSMDVEYGQYSVILLVEGFPPSHAGTITVYEDSQPGTLNDFLGATTEDDARPEALRRFEQMVEEVSRHAAEVENHVTIATEAAREAADSAARSEKNAESAEGAAQRAEASAEIATSSAQAASASADSAASDAGVASESANSARSSEVAAATSAELAGKHENNAAASALSALQAEASAAESARVATDKAEDASNHELEAKLAAQAAKQSETESARSEVNAALSADAAEQSAIRAEESSVQVIMSANEVKQNVAEAALQVSVVTQKAEDAAASASAAEQNRVASEGAASEAIAAAERAEDIASAIGLEDASLTRKGVVRLSNETDSDSEREAATPKAVKDVMDETRRLNESLDGKQPLNEKLTALSALDTSEDVLAYFSDENTLSVTPLTEKARSWLGQTESAGMREILELGSSATRNIQSNIHDRTEGVVAIPGGLGYGGYFSFNDKVIFRGENGLADFISWVSLMRGEFGEIRPFTVTEDMLATAREVKKQEINAWRDKQENGSIIFEFNGRGWDGGKASQARLSPVLAAAQADMLPPGFFWTDADNRDVELTTEELVQLAGAMTQAMVVEGFRIHERQRQMKEEVAALDTLEAIRSYPVGWTEVERE